jgi:hypothetical protein
MNPYEIYIAYISWDNGGKRRPVVFLAREDGYAEVLRITSQFANKSNAVKTQYLEITDWQQAGLSKVSYIDTIETVEVPIAMISPPTPIGKLTEKDKQRLLEILNK